MIKTSTVLFTRGVVLFVSTAPDGIIDPEEMLVRGGLVNLLPAR